MKMLSKDMLAKTRGELLPRIQKNQNEKTIMVTIWHPAPKYLSKILQEKYHKHTETDVYLKKVFPEKPVIAFRKMKSIRNHIVRRDIKGTNDQKKSKITVHPRVGSGSRVQIGVP